MFRAEQSIIRWQPERSLFASTRRHKGGGTDFQWIESRRRGREGNNNWIESLAQLFVQTQKLINMHGALWLFFHKSRYNKNMWRTFLSDMACSQSERWPDDGSVGHRSTWEGVIRAESRSEVTAERLPEHNNFPSSTSPRLEVYQEDFYD
jgi:hypothetical protein